MKSFVLIPIFLLLFTSVTNADESTYLCIAEESTGFYFENGSWGRAHFKVSDEKYIIRKMKEVELEFFGGKHPYGVYSLGGKYPEYRCSVTESSNNYICRDGVGDFLFSPKSGRFIKSYMAGYWDGEDKNEDTPSITRGRCSKI